MADVLAGFGGLFGGLTNGIRLLYMLQQAERERQQRDRQLNIQQGELDLNKQKYADVEADKPYADIQGQLNKQNVTATLPDIRREYTPPAVGDTYQPTNKFAPPAFGSDPGFTAPRDARQGFGTDPGFKSPFPDNSTVGNDPGFRLDTSHVGQALQRGNRASNFQRSQSILSDVLAAAGQRAQATQAPVAGSFDTGQGTAELPSGFTAQPDRTFSPWQMSPRPSNDPDDLLYKPLLNDPKKQLILKVTDPAGYQRFLDWQTRRLGYGTSPTSPSGPPTPKQDFSGVQSGSSTTPNVPAPSMGGGGPPPKGTSPSYGNVGTQGTPQARPISATPPSSGGGRGAAPDSLIVRLLRSFNGDTARVAREIRRLGYDDK